MGRPKDGDWHAGYVLLDVGTEETVEFVRMPWMVRVGGARRDRRGIAGGVRGVPADRGQAHAGRDRMSGGPLADPRRYLAELLGTFVLVALGPGAAMVSASTGASGMPVSHSPSASR